MSLSKKGISVMVNCIEEAKCFTPTGLATCLKQTGTMVAHKKAPLKSKGSAKAHSRNLGEVNSPFRIEKFTLMNMVMNTLTAAMKSSLLAGKCEHRCTCVLLTKS